MPPNPSGPGTEWEVARHVGPAAELHALVPPTAGRHVWVLEPVAPAVVLGSTQHDDVVDVAAAERAGIAIARRRSGGGAVWVAPQDPVWVDIIVPRGDRLWHDDVGRAFLPIGEAWRAALAAVGVTGTRVHDGPLVRTEWSDLVCFAGRGPGEVFRGDAKVVGLSQRRTRHGARFQCAVHRRWDPEPLRGLLRPAPVAGALDGCGAGIGPVPSETLIAALVAGLDQQS